MSYKRSCGDKRKRLKRKNYFFVSYDKPYKIYHLSGKRKFCKKQTNKFLRNNKNMVLSSPSQYRKVFDYWWTIF